MMRDATNLDTSSSQQGRRGLRAGKFAPGEFFEAREQTSPRK